MTPAQPPMGWANTTLGWGIVLLTAAQTVVVLRFAGVPEIPLPRSSARATTVLLWNREQVHAAFMGVPETRRDVLEQDVRDAFQSVAQRSLPAPQYRLAEWREPSRWLTNPPPVPPVSAAPAPISHESFPTLASAPKTDARPAASRQTSILAGGALADRSWVKSPVIAPWRGPENPGVTRFEAAVNPQGWIVVLRVSEGSGSREADDAALAALRDSLLSPLPGAPKKPSFEAASMAWGTLAIHWGLPPSGS